MTIEAPAEQPSRVRLDAYGSGPGLPVVVDADTMLSSIDNHCQTGRPSRIARMVIPLRRRSWLYGDRLVLSRFGIQTRGRSRRLTLNYRSSRENLQFTLGVISGAEVLDSDGDPETVAGYRAAFDGPTPTTKGFTSPADEAAFMAATVQDWVAGGVAASSIGVLVRRHADQERARQAHQSAGISVEVLGPNPQSRPSAVVVTTMHRAKGMEFSRVVVFGVEAGVVPLKYVVDQVQEADQPIVLGRERSLLYVACSRARDELVITWSGTPSPFLPVERPS